MDENIEKSEVQNHIQAKVEIRNASIHKSLVLKQKAETYHVCAEGRRSVERSSRWIWNFWTPFMPSRAANPWSGTLEVPVTNCKNLARAAWSNERRARQNHWICEMHMTFQLLQGSQMVHIKWWDRRSMVKYIQHNITASYKNGMRWDQYYCLLQYQRPNRMHEEMYVMTGSNHTEPNIICLFFPTMLIL